MSYADDVHPVRRWTHVGVLLAMKFELNLINSEFLKDSYSDMLVPQVYVFSDKISLHQVSI